MYIYLADIQYLNDSTKAKQKYIKINLRLWLTTKSSSIFEVMYIYNNKYGNKTMKYQWKLPLSILAIINKQLKRKQQIKYDY